jgi:hypothetical protein
VFYFDPGTVGGNTYALANLTIAGGTDKQDGYGGGGILSGNYGTGLPDKLTMTNCVIAHNSAANSGGGGLNVDGGSVNLVGCTFRNNFTTNSAPGGGGIFFEPFNQGDTLTAINCVFQQNTASPHDANSQGGAVLLYPGSVTQAANFTNCVFSGNAAVSSGSSANQNYGGGALNIGSNTVANVIGCTFTNNSVSGGTGGTAGTGGNGGAVLVEPTAALSLHYSRFVNNLGVSGGGTNLWGDLNSTINDNDNWWGSDSGPAVGSVQNVDQPANWLFLINTASSTSIAAGGTATLTASFLTDSAGNAISASNLVALANVAISFGATDGSISAAQTAIQSSGTATATFSGTNIGTGSGSATVDGVTSTTSITVQSIVVNSLSSSPANAYYQAGQTVTILVTFNGAVTVTGTPELALSDGGTATYVGGSGTTTLIFAYTVVSGDTSTNLDCASTNALTLNGGTIGAVGLAAILTLPSPGTAGSLGANANLVIDTTPPTVSVSAPSVAYVNSTGTVSYTVSWIDTNLNSSSINLSTRQVLGNLNTTGTATANSISVTGTGNARTVLLARFTGIGTVGFSVPAGTAADFAGNAATASSPSPTVIVDATPPSVVISPPSVTSTNSGSVSYTVTFSDASLAYTSLSATNIATQQTGSATLTNLTVTPGTGTATSTNYTVTLWGLAGNGTLGFIVSSNAATDLAGNQSAATASGTFTVFTTPPVLTGVQVTGQGVIRFSFTNNPNATFTVLSSTNLSLPPTNWTVVGAPTNNPPGVFQYASPPTPNDPQRFYLIQSQ